MDVLLERCAGLDVGKHEVVACVRTPAPGRSGRRSELRTFPTFTGDLEALADWLSTEGVTAVVMEATGQYWKPVWYVLEDRQFDLKLVNAKHVKMVPGRKTDLADAAWLAELLEHGLLRGSFVPPVEIRERWASPRFVEAWTMRRGHARDTEEVRRGVPRWGGDDRPRDRQADR